MHVQCTMYNVHIQYKNKEKKCDKIPGRDKRNRDNNLSIFIVFYHCQYMDNAHKKEIWWMVQMVIDLESETKDRMKLRFIYQEKCAWAKSKMAMFRKSFGVNLFGPVHYTINTMHQINEKLV